MESFKEFKAKVQAFCYAEDYKENANKLEQISSEHQELFLDCLKKGAEILPGIKIVEYLERFGKEEELAPDKLLGMYTKFIWINSLFDIEEYKETSV